VFEVFEFILSVCKFGLWSIWDIFAILLLPRRPEGENGWLFLAALLLHISIIQTDRPTE